MANNLHETHGLIIPVSKSHKEASVRGNRKANIDQRTQFLSEEIHQGRNMDRKLVTVESARPFAPAVAAKSGRPMQVTGPTGEIFVAHKVQGEKPDWSHVAVPFRKSAVDAAVVFALAVTVEIVAFRNGWVPWVGFVDFLIYNVLMYLAFLGIDWFWFGNSSVLDLKTKDTWVLPEVEKPQETVEVSPVTVEIQQTNGRKRVIPNAAPDGWDSERLMKACKNLEKSLDEFAFSQPKTGLSSHSYDRLKEHWLMLDFIELQSGFENRYQLTPAGVDFIENFVN